MEQIHTIAPVFDKNSRILILGSFPSVKSREAKFFYGHPQNRFWKTLAAVMNSECPQTIDDKKRFLLDNRIAIWDVIKSCDIDGSADSSIKNVVPNDFTEILSTADIRQIYANGAASYSLYKKYCEKTTGREIIKLPSTSPANAQFSLERLVAEWSIIKNEKAGND